MWKTAEDVSSADKAILQGILDGFGEDVAKIDKLNAEVKRIFTSIKQDSEGLPDGALYQLALHMSKNRVRHLLEKKKEAPTPLVIPEQKFVQPIIKRKKEPTAPASTPILEPAPIEEAPVPEKESDEDLIRRAILDGFRFPGNLADVTTLEHIDAEANKLLQWYKERAKEYSSISPGTLYEAVFRAAKKWAEEIVKAHALMQEKDTRREMRARRKEEEAQAAVERERIAGVARLELKELVAKMLEEEPLSPVSKESLRYFKLIYLDDKRDPDVVHLFPGTTRDQRYKWKERAINLIAPRASDDARRYISEKTKRKLASVELLFKAAQLFLMRCEDNYE